jgi:flagellar biosynthesis protein FlhF
MAAKVAAYLRSREEQPTGLITTDVANTNGALRLRNYAERLHLPMTAAQSASELRDALQRWGNRGPLVLDTPGLTAEATETVKTLLDWLRSWIPAIETHLVLDIDSRIEHLTFNLESLREAGCQKIMLTRMDQRSEAVSSREGTLAAVLSARMPISFLGTGTRVPEDLAIPTPGRLMTCLA